MKHELKSHPVYFRASWSGSKPFEIRRDDRLFNEADEVLLREWDPQTQRYSGREIEGLIEYITAFEQQPGYVVFSVRETGRRG